MTKTKSRNSRQAAAVRMRATSKRSKKPLFLHHRHSFKLMHHSHTSYPLMAFVILLTGIFSFGWTTYVQGDAYNVTAVVSVAPLTSASTITSPSDGTKSIINIITISGNCPANSYIKLFRNQNFAGTTLCQADGTWSIQTSLQLGNNLLESQAYNVTNQPGPTANGINVSYLPPATTNTTSSQAAQAAKASPLLLGSTFTYKGYYSNQLSQWPLSITGGTGPYAVQIDWGDGQTDLETLEVAGDFEMRHSYTHAGGYKNSYIIKVTVRDSTGQVSLLQLFTIISPIGSAASSSSSGEGVGSAGSSSDDGNPSDIASPYQRFWAVAGPTYVVTSIAVASFWLGERRGLEMLRPKYNPLQRPRFRH